MSSTFGALKTLVAMLQAAPMLQSSPAISIAFGEENIRAQEFPLPMVVVVPQGGNWGPPGTPGYYRGANVDQFNIWMTQENIDLYLWGFDTTEAAQPIDHADATEDLRARVLQAFQNQQANCNDGTNINRGLMFRPTSGRWELAQEESNRYGRVYILTVQVDISIPNVQPVEVTVDEITINPIDITV